MKVRRFHSIPSFKQAVSAFAMCAVLAGGAGFLAGYTFPGAALADDTSEGPKKDEAPGNQGGQGQGGQGSQAGQGNQGGDGAGQGGPGDDSDGKGPQAGGPSDDGSGGGKPAWAQEGIPEVELGRLSVARSPDHVLERALDEAVATLTPEMITFYNLPLDGAGGIIDELSNNWDNITIFDSPLQNLALLEELLAGGSTSLTGVTNDSDTLMAVFLGVASDKNVVVSVDTVVAIVTIFGLTISEADAAALAEDAEAVRIAVLAGHG